MTHPKDSPALRVCSTRQIKNGKHLLQVAPRLRENFKPGDRYGDLLPESVLAHLHKPEAWAAIQSSPEHAKLLKGVKLPTSGNAATDPLFKGILHFVEMQFKIQNQGNNVVAVSNADLSTAIDYSIDAATPISEYSSLYGTNSIAISPTTITYGVTLSDNIFTDQDLQDWVNKIAANNNLPTSACVVVLCPQGVINRDGDPGNGIGGYHSMANLPYIFVNVFGQNLTVADAPFYYAQILSHEIAEMVVDPLANAVNPEVCDPCGPNCQTVFLDYFDATGNYISTTQTMPQSVNFQYAFYINGIVQPASATACPAPANACDYSPPLRLWVNWNKYEIWNWLIGSLADGPLWVIGPHGPVPVPPGPLPFDARERAERVRANIIESIRELELIGTELTREKLIGALEKRSQKKGKA